MARLDNLDYEVNGVTTNYEIVPEIAPLFNATTAYAAGDTVIKEGHLYRFNTAHAAGAWIGTDADEITVGEELTAHDADIVQIKNLQAPAILSDTYSGTTLSTINVNIPAGTYTLEVESLTSADVDTELSLVTFVYSGGSLSVRLPRERNIQKKVTFKGDVTTMYLYASDSYAHSVGDAFSFTGLKLITGYPLKDEVDDLSQTVQGLSGRYTTYEAGGRTFTDNTLAYIGANNTIVLGNTNGYAVYTYNITEPTSFVVTGSTRGASNYIAIATDDSGKCVQTIEQGASATTKSYSNFEFTIDDFEATTVYICLYKQPTDEVLIKLNKDVKELSILFVGNSLTQDGIAYLPYLLTRYYPEFRFRFYMWYNGGYDLSQQYAKFTADTECESFSIAEGTPAWTNTTAKMSDVLSTYRFNIVCMQEYFNRKASYTDADLTDWNNCHDYIVSHYTGGNALEFISLFHSPWLTDEQSVYDLTKTGNALILKKTVADDMIATGIALHMARSTALDSLGDQGHLTPDDVHAQEGLPCLLETYTALLWVLDRYGFPTTIYGLPFKMTAGIQSSIAVPGANIGTGVIEGTDAQNLLAQEVAVMAYKVGKKFVVDNLTADDELTKLKADFTQLAPKEETVDLSKVNKVDYYVTAENKWAVNYHTYFVPVIGGQTATLLTTYRWGSVYVLLKDDSCISGQTPSFCDGYAQRYTFSQNVPVDIVVPDDCKFIGIRIDNSISDFSIVLSTGLWTYAEYLNDKTNKNAKGTNTVYVAASNSTDNDKALADYICSGTNDEITIQSAINSVYGKGVKNGTIVYLLAGDYYIDSFPNTNYDGHVAIMLPSKQSVDTIGTDVYAVSIFGMDYNTENVVLHVTDSAYNDMNTTDSYSVIAAEKDWYYNHYAIHDIRIYVPSAQKKIVCFDGRRMGAMDCRRLKAIALDHATWNTPSSELVLPNFHSIGVAGACFDSNSWNYTWDSIYCIGFGQGFAVGGEHLLARKCVAIYGRYGFTFHANMDESKVQAGDVPSHPDTLIACSDEANANFWLFGGGNTRRPVIQCYDLSIEFWPQWFSLDGHYATEEEPGQFSGYISYAISGGSVSVPWWGNGSGHNFTTVNLNQSRQTTEAIRKTYAPNMGQEVFDTTLNKLAICTEPWTKEWRDAMGTVLT